MSKLDELRKAIDGIDDEILELLNRRAGIAVEIGEIKKKRNAEFHVPGREKAIIDRLTKRNKGPFPNESLRVILREIFSASLALESPVKIAYFGPSATFTHLACLQQFGNSAQYIPVASIREVFGEVERGLAVYGVVPVENSTEGIVSHTLDMLMDSDLKIAAEIMLEVSHNLMSKSGDIRKVEKVYSHPQPAAQCRKWLESNLSGVPVKEAASTSKAAEMAAFDESAAAIASRLAAEIYGLKIIKERIEDNIDNFTRFLAIAKKSPKKTGRDKTTILFSVADKAGALYEMLKPFAANGINLTKIESRPSRKKAWEYHFFVDMEGHYDDDRVKKAIDELGENCLFLKVLGSYPAAEPKAGK